MITLKSIVLAFALAGAAVLPAVAEGTPTDTSQYARENAERYAPSHLYAPARHTTRPELYLQQRGPVQRIWQGRPTQPDPLMRQELPPGFGG